MLESFLTPVEAKRNSWSLFFMGLIYSSIAILLSLIVFPSQASIFSIFLTAIATTPLFVNLLKDEENLNLRLIDKKEQVFHEQLDLISVFFFLFLGYTVSFSLWFSFLPDWALQSVFSEQVGNILSMQSLVTGNVVFNGLFELIFMNNLRVLFFCLLFSFIYGAGAVLILAWNASVLGAAVGLFIREQLVKVVAGDYFSGIIVYFSSLPYGLGQYMFHGIFELMAYFLASLAGGIISAAVVRRHYKSRNFFKLFQNTSYLIIGGIIFLLIAAFIEVNI